MGSEDLLSRTLINTMCIFDNSYDKTAIKEILKIYGIFLWTAFTISGWAT